MNIMNDLVFSMLSYSRNYQPYVYSWGKRVGKDIVKERLELEASLKLKAKNVFEHGLIAGALEELTSRKMPLDKKSYSPKRFAEMRLKEIRADPDPALLKLSYPHIFLSPGSHTLLYWVGKETGSDVGRKHKHRLSELEKISNRLKIGKVEFKKNKIVLHDSVFAKNFEQSGKKVCSYYAGFAAGFLSSGDKKFNVVETKCTAHGDNKCEFILIS